MGGLTKSCNFWQLCFYWVMVGFRAQSVQLVAGKGKGGLRPMVYWSNCLRSSPNHHSWLPQFDRLCLVSSFSTRGRSSSSSSSFSSFSSTKGRSKERSKDADGRQLESSFQGQVLSLWHRGKSNGSRFFHLLPAEKYYGEQPRLLDFID